MSGSFTIRYGTHDRDLPTGADSMIIMSKGRARLRFIGAGRMVMTRIGTGVPALHLREGQ